MIDLDADIGLAFVQRGINSDGADFVGAYGHVWNRVGPGAAAQRGGAAENIVQIHVHTIHRKAAGDCSADGDGSRSSIEVLIGDGAGNGHVRPRP